MPKSFKTNKDKLLYCQRQVMHYFREIAAIVCSLRFVNDEAQNITLHALPDGTCLYRNEFIDAVPFNQLASLQAHIAFHTAIQEYERARFCGAAPWKFRIALESHIYAMLQHAGMLEIFGTDEHYHPEWDDMAPEKIARMIADPPPGIDPVAHAINMCPARLPLDIGKRPRVEKQDGLLGGSGSGTPIMTSALANAEAMAKSIGNGTLGAKIQVRQTFEPQVKWEDQLRFAVGEVMGPQGRTYKRPNRRAPGMARALGRPYIPLPSTNKGLDAVWMPMDLSGSVVHDPGLVGAFLAEMQKILDICRRPCRVIFHTDEIVDNFVTSDMKEVEKRLVGDGGTDFRPVYELIAKSKEPIPMVVWLTDMFGYHGRRPNVPFLWCTGMTHGLIPWGRHVKVKPRLKTNRTDDGNEGTIKII